MQNGISRTLQFSRTPVGGGILALSLLGVSVLSGCAREGDAKPPATATPAAGASSDLPDVLATVGSEPIKLEDLRSRVGQQLDILEIQYLRARSKVIDTTLTTMVRERVLQAEATKQGKTVDDLLAAEIGTNLEPSALEVSTWYEDNQLRLRGRTIDQLRPSIVALLKQERRTEAIKKVESRVSKDLNVTVNFEPYRITFDNEGAPTLGNKGAPVTIVEFSDFQCPYCQGFAPVLKRIAKEYGDKVFIVYRQNPIPSLHPEAFKAAEASLCAHEDGKFWELHDLMFAEQNKLKVADLKQKARSIGLSGRKFDSCLDSGKYVERIQTDAAFVTSIGHPGTPAVFVNGIHVEGGAVPFETIAGYIDRELERKKP